MRENLKLKRLIGALVMALSLAAHDWTVAAEPKTAEQIVDALQKNYDATVDFVADFKQETEVKSLNRSLKAWGKLSFTRRGKMLWRYEEPKGQIVLADGSHLYFLQPEQNQVIKIFTVVTVVFMPPTLIASIYGMNFKFMPELQWMAGYPWRNEQYVIV